jgi:DNA primase
MARIKASCVAEVKAAADIVEVVSARTALRRSGSRWSGRCPFHEERTPSFSVNREQKLYHCFGCGKGGDVVSFVMETESLDFTSAIEFLAERFRVPLEYEESSPAADQARKRRERHLSLLEAATAFYERYLWETKAGEPVRAYLEGRGLGEAVCREFRLGLAPEGGSTLARKAQERGFTRDELVATGLVGRRGTDYFSGRLLFPLSDARGKIVGFQARKLREDDPLRAKYVNSPESDLFRKGDILYGLDKAKSAIARQDRAVVVEGNTDVLALRQAGVEPVVASMGTALTERQLKELGRLTRRLWLCFDGDAAGEAATLRGMELAQGQGLEVKVVALPPGVDPADAPAEFEGRLGAAASYLMHRVRLEIDRAADRQEAFVRVRELLGKFEESPDRTEAVRYAADRLDLPRETQAGLAPRAGGGGGRTGTASPKLLAAGDRLERQALAAAAAHSQLRPLLHELSEEHFDAVEHRSVRTHLVDGTELPAPLVPLLAELDALAVTNGIDETAGKQLLLKLRERRLQREIDAAGDDLVRITELRAQLARIRTAVAELK